MYETEISDFKFEAKLNLQAHLDHEAANSQMSSFLRLSFIWGFCRTILACVTVELISAGLLGHLSDL